MGEIELIKRDFQQGSGEWKQFIQSIKISNIHGWQGQEILFKFPVVAIVGENGIGKSTFLKASVCAYKNKSNKVDFYPSKMFMRTQWDEDALEGALIEYRVRQGDNSSKILKWKKTKDWGYSPKTAKPERNVFFLDISRTLPLDATAGYAKIAMNSNAEAGEGTDLSEESIRELSYILGQEYIKARFTGTNVDAEREVGLLTGRYGEISQFHQGAGEDSILDLFKLLQDIPSQSLLVIDEVENSLHPKAQRRLVKYLLKISRRKRIQIILSTHSPFVLEELPEVARVMLIRLSDKKDIVYGVSSQYALSTIDEQEHPELYVHVEDKEAEVLFWEILKNRPEEYDSYLHKIKVVNVGSASVVNMLHKLELDNLLPYNSISIVDGDMKDTYPNCTCFPGDKAPEKMIFHELKSINWNNLENRFGIGAGSLYSYLDEAILLTDHHSWCSALGDSIKKSKDVVWSILVEEWCKQCMKKADAESFIDNINNALEKRSL